MQSSIDRLEKLQSELPNQIQRSKDNQGNIKFIVERDPAYTQMFNARDFGIGSIIDGYKSISDNVQSLTDNKRASKRNNRLRFICSADNSVKSGDGSPYCG